MNNEQLWQAVLGEIEVNLSRANFITWFKDTFISSFEQNKVIVGVPNAFAKKWLEEKYHKSILGALEKISHQKISEIQYRVELKRDASSRQPINNYSFSNNQPANLETTPSATPESRIDGQKTNSCGLNTRYLFENFVVGKGNELAYAACKAVVDRPGEIYNPLFIYGGVGLGKTHLLQAVGNDLLKKTSKILYTTSEKFMNNYVQAVHGGRAKEFKSVYRNVDLLLVDDVQFMGGKDGTQEEFFHTFNELLQDNKQIVLTSDRPPKLIPAVEKRLTSRFESGMVVDVGKPDVETKMAILEKKANEKNFPLDREVLSYVAGCIQNNVRELEGALNKIIASHQLNKVEPSIKSVKNILSDILANAQPKNTTPKDIIEAVVKYYGITNKDLLGEGRKKELVWPRQVAIYLMREELNTSYPTIGEELGGRDHTTAMHAYNKISNELKKENEKLKQELDSIKQLLD